MWRLRTHVEIQQPHCNPGSPTCGIPTVSRSTAPMNRHHSTVVCLLTNWPMALVTVALSCITHSHQNFHSWPIFPHRNWALVRQRALLCSDNKLFNSIQETLLEVRLGSHDMLPTLNCEYFRAHAYLQRTSMHLRRLQHLTWYECWHIHVKSAVKMSISGHL